MPTRSRCDAHPWDAPLGRPKTIHQKEVGALSAGATGARRSDITQSIESGQRQHLAPAVAAGIDHVRLLYHYLDAGDLDGCASLLDDDVRLWSPGAPVGRGRAEVLGLQRRLADPGVRHEAGRIVAAGDTIAVAGRLVHPGGQVVEFADFFTVSGEGMLRTQRRYYFVPPA